MAELTQGGDFNQENPPKRITDPDGAGAQTAFPAHVHRHVVKVDDEDLPENTVVVAWKGRKPIHNEFREVKDQKALDQALREGFSAKPQLEPKKPAARE